MPEFVELARYQECASSLTFLPGVQAVDVIEDDPRIGGPCIEVVIGPGYDRVPPRIHGILRDHDLGIDPGKSGVRGSPKHLTVVVR